MIALLKGRVEFLGDGDMIVDVNGVGYLVFASSRTLSQVGVGDAITIHIETHVREDHIHLYGFLSRDEQAWFKLLTTVQGVGAKVGLAILSVLSGDELTHAIAAGDKAQVGRANGVGPKLAQRIVTELKDKVANLALGPASQGTTVKTAAVPEGEGLGALTRDATSALTHLGYSPSDALAAVSHAAGKLGEAVKLEDLITAALSELGPKEH